VLLVIKIRRRNASRSRFGEFARASSPRIETWYRHPPLPHAEGSWMASSSSSLSSDTSIFAKASIHADMPKKHAPKKQKKIL